MTYFWQNPVPSKFVYRVVWRIHVDHPEKRDPTYPRVDPGTVLLSQKDFHGPGAMKRAVAMREEIVKHEPWNWTADSSSEYIDRVTVTRIDVTKTASPHIVRKRIERECRECPWETYEERQERLGL